MESERAGIEGKHDPWIVGVEVDGFDSRGSFEHEFFDLETEGHF